jgi:hypothetical protein
MEVQPPNALLVFLAARRNGTGDWPGVSAAVSDALGALGYACTLGAEQCEAVFKEHGGREGEDGVSKVVEELTSSRVIDLTAAVAAIQARAAEAEQRACSAAADGGADAAQVAADDAEGARGRGGDGGDGGGGSSGGGRRGSAPVEAPSNDIEGVDSWPDLAEEERNPRRASVQGTLLKMVRDRSGAQCRKTARPQCSGRSGAACCAVTQWRAHALSASRSRALSLRCSP